MCLLFVWLCQIGGVVILEMDFDMQTFVCVWPHAIPRDNVTF